MLGDSRLQDNLAGHKGAWRLQGEALCFTNMDTVGKYEMPYLPVPTASLHSALQQQEELPYAALIDWSHSHGMFWPQMRSKQCIARYWGSQLCHQSRAHVV